MHLNNTNRVRIASVTTGAAMPALIFSFFAVVGLALRGCWWITLQTWRGGRHLLARHRAARAAR